jgi:DNA-binding FadR family transcriptional regulator
MTSSAIERTTKSPARNAATSTASLDAVLRPVRSGNAFEEAIQRIMQAIKLGAVTTGERLPPERTLAKRLGISRVTLREALRALTDAGLVESRRGRSGGTFITYRPEDAEPPAAPTDKADIRLELEDSLVLRAVLEPGAAEAAARREHDADAQAMLHDRVEAVAATTTRQSHRLADARLHLAIAELSGSVSLIAAVADVQMSMTDLLESIPVVPRNIERSHEQHAAIANAILTGRPEDARRHMQEHVSGTAALLRGFLA